MDSGAAPGVEGTPPHPDIIDEPRGLDIGFEHIPFENVLWIKQAFNKEEPIHYAPLAHSRVFIPQDKLMELSKYYFVVPEEVHFSIEDIEAVSDFKVSAQSQTPIYIQDIKVDVWQNKGDLSSPCQFYPFPDADDFETWLNLHKTSELGEYGELPECKLAQNNYVQQTGTKWSTKKIYVSRRDVRWQTINIKPEVVNISQSWTNQVSFMMMPFHFFKDIGTEVRVPCVLSLLKEHTDDPDDLSDLGRSIDESGIKDSTKGQSASSFQEGVLGTSFFTQLGKSTHCCRALGIAFERVDYFSGWTSIFAGHWDDFQDEHFKDHTQFSQRNFCELGVYSYNEGTSASSSTTKIHKNGISGRGCPYPRLPLMYNPEFCKEDFVQKTYLRTPYTKQKLIQMYNDSSYVPFGKEDSGRQNNTPYLQMPYIQPFCSNKTLKHFYWKFQHKLTGNDKWIKGTLYYKIHYKVVFTCYFKSGHAQGTEDAKYTVGNHEYKLSEITKDHGGGVVHHEVNLKSPITFHDVTVHDWNYRIFHPKSCIMYIDRDKILV